MPTAKKSPSGSWRVRVYVGREDGKDKYKMFSGSTKREAERKATNYLVINNHSELVFKDAALRYIEAKKNVLSPNTIRTYQQRMAHLEALYTVRMSKIDTERVQRVIDRLSMDLSPKTVRSVYGFVTAVVKMFEPFAVLNVTLPEPEHKETRIPTEEEVRKLIAGATDPDLALAIQLAAFGSLRSGEACALCADMVSEDHIRIARTYVLAPNSRYEIKNSPKTQAGYRDIPLPGPLMAQIKARAEEGDHILKYNPGSLHDAFRRLTKRLGMHHTSITPCGTISPPHCTTGMSRTR